MGKIMELFKEMNKASFYVEWDDKPKQEIHNNYYITVDNRCIKVGEQGFNKYLQKNNLLRIGKRERDG